MPMPLAAPFLRGVLSVHAIEGHPDAALSPAELEQAVRKGHATLTLCQSNLVVNTGLQTLSRFLGSNRGTPTIGSLSISDLSDLTVASMQLGNAVAPPAPASSDTGGVRTLVYTPSLAVSYPTDYAVLFSGLVAVGIAAGVTFTEEALLLKNGLLFAKTTFIVPKPTGYAIQFSHQISMNRA